MADREPIQPPGGAAVEETVGQMLRRERTLRGVSLEEIATTTRISLNFLRAMEADRFEELPSGVFLRGFIRNVAEYLGLDANQVLDHVREQQNRLATRTLVGVRASEVEQAMLRTVAGDTAPLSPARLAVPALIALALIAAGGAGLYFGLRTRHPRTVSAPATPAAADGSAAPVAAAAAEPVTLEITVGSDDRRAFVRLTVDDVMKFQGELKRETAAPAVLAGSGPAGPRKDQIIERGRKFELYTSSAGALQIRVDGKILPALGRRGETLTHWEYRAGIGVVNAPSAPSP